MKLSTKSRYGLNALYHLAQMPADKTVAIKELSEITNVPMPYLEKVMGILKKHKFVNSTRGVLGGYNLAVDPQKVTIGEILRALESDLVFSDCAKTGKCTNLKCPNKDIFKVIYDNLNSVLDNITLQQMVQKEGEKNG